MKRFAVTVEDLDFQLKRKEVHQADSWQSAVLCHSMVGAEFEDLVDDADLEKRCEDYGYKIEVTQL